MGANIGPDELTPKQDLFSKEYIVDFNATQAAIRAKYSKKTAGFIGHENLQKPKIQKRIEHYKKQLMLTADITIEQIVNELAILGFSDLTDLFVDRKGIVMLDDIKKLPAYVRRAIKSFELEGGKLKVKFHSKEKSLELLGRYRSMFKENLNINGQFKTDNELIIKVVQVDGAAPPPKKKKGKK